MAKISNKQNTAKPGRVTGPRNQKRKEVRPKKYPKTMAVSVPRPLDSSVMKYRKLLFDPCSADLVEPPYLGVESGYLIRTRDVIVPSFTGVGLTGTVFDYHVQWCPGNLGVAATTGNYGLLTGGSTSGNMVVQAGLRYTNGLIQSNFINTSGTSAASYRVVACCMKYIPFGPTLNRQGIISLINAPSPVYAINSVVNTTGFEAMCPHPATNGSESHEIVWLPGSKDQEYGMLESFVQDPGYGTLICSLAGVDSAVAGNGTFAGALGRVEITTIWQWTAKESGGVLQSIHAPHKFTVNDALTTVRDLGSAVYTGAKMLGSGLAFIAQHV